MNGELLEWLQAERKRGRRLILCTAANHDIAQRVAAHHGIFDEVVASDRSSNLTGKAKAAELERRYGSGRFDYAGNEIRDIHVWKHARVAPLSLTLPRPCGAGWGR